MKIKFKKNDIFQFIQAWLTTGLFSLTLLYFISFLLMVPFSLQQVIFVCFVSSLLVFCLFKFWKITAPAAIALLIVVGIQFVIKKNIDLPVIGLPFWTKAYSDTVLSLNWAFKASSRGPMPLAFSYLMPIALSTIAVLTNWLLPIPLLNMAFLILPMFFIEDLSIHPQWMVWLMLGLFCVYSSYAFRQDPENHDQRPPLIFGLSLLILTFVLQSILPASLFFNEDLSRKLNDRLPNIENKEIKSFSLAELGFYPRGNLRVGGPVKLSDTKYLSIKAEADSFYLRGAAYDNFDGNSWSLKSRQKLLPYKRNVDFFDDFSSDQANCLWFSDEEMRNRAFSNNILTPSSYFLKTEGESHIVFNGGKPMFLSHLSKEIDDTISMDDLFDKYHDGTNFYYSNIGTLVSDRPYNKYGLVELDYINLLINVKKAAWTKIFTPVMMPPQRKYEAAVRNYDPALAEILYDQDNSLSDLISKMKEHINANYQYELNVVYPKDSENFIEHFLKTKKGYCVYFASLYSVLLDDIGYQSRYAEGFIIPQAKDSDQQLTLREISALQAHAWTELYVAGLGWMPIECTPSDHIADISGVSDDSEPIKGPHDPLLNELSPESSEESSENESSYDQESNQSESSDSQDINDQENDFSNDLSKKEAPEEPTRPFNQIIGWIVCLIGLIVLIGLLAFLWAYRSYKAYLRSFDLNYLLKQGNNRLIMANMWTSIKRLSKLNSIEEKNTDTVADLIHIWKFEFTDLLSDLSEKESAEILERFLYSSQEISDDDIRNIHQIYKAMAESYRNNNSKLKWFIRDVLLVKR